MTQTHPTSDHPSPRPVKRWLTAVVILLIIAVIVAIIVAVKFSRG
ncbi:MAG TPA: hypothetical protein VIL86_15180 [Tepidisphaeraceae bacterium]